MLPRKHRVPTEVFRNLFEGSKTYRSQNIVLRVKPLSAFFQKISEKSRFSFVVSKKVSKKAPERNTLKRRGYAIIHNHLPFIESGYVFVFFFQKKANDLTFKELDEEIVFLLQKSGFYKEK